jgi:hypothetical protein
VDPDGDNPPKRTLMPLVRWWRAGSTPRSALLWHSTLSMSMSGSLTAGPVAAAVGDVVLGGFL